MIDSVLQFASLAAAKNDPVLQRHRGQLQDWIGSYVLPNIRVWRVSQDVAGVDPNDGSPTVTHTYLPGWSLIIALPQIVAALLNHPNLQVMIDRDLAIARRHGMIIKANVTPVVMQDIRFEPVFMDADYPWGAWS